MVKHTHGPWEVNEDGSNDDSQHFHKMLVALIEAEKELVSFHQKL